MRRSRAKNFARESLVLFYQVYMSFIVYLLKGSFATECILNLKPSAHVATRSRPPSPRHPYDHIKPTTIAFKPKPSSTSRCRTSLHQHYSKLSSVLHNNNNNNNNSKNNSYNNRIVIETSETI